MNTFRHPDYRERFQDGLRKKVEASGYKFYKGLPSITMRQLYRIEKGDCSPTLETLQKIADDLKIDMLDLFEK